MAVFLWMCFLMVNSVWVIQTTQSTPQSCPKVPRTCHDVYSNGKDKYKIATMEDGTTHVCEMLTDNGGWTVIQRRFNGDVNFYRNYMQYKYGFGDMHGDFWWGLEKMADITTKGVYELYVSFDFDNTSYYASYDTFRVFKKEDNYRLELGDYSGTAGDSLRVADNMLFSTYDNDNDRHARNCAEIDKGGWWYNACQHVNLNGLWNSTKFGRGTNWGAVTGFQKCTYNIEMKVRLTVPISD